MLVSLKKAADFQRLCLEAANKIEPKAVVPVSTYTKGDPNIFVTAAFTQGSENFNNDIEVALKLIEAGYEIRWLLSEANARLINERSVNQLLGQRAMIEAQEKRVAAIIQLVTNAKNEFGSQEMIGRIEHLRKVQETGTPDRRSYYEDTPGRSDMSVVSESQIEMLRDKQAELRARKSEITDELARLNLNNRVEIPQWVLDIMRQHKLIAA